MVKSDVLFRQEGTLGLLDFPKDVTAQTREPAYIAYNELARLRVRVLALNFEKTDYMNSAGVSLVISVVEDATQAGRTVIACGMNAHYRKLFSYAGLADRLTFVDNESALKKRLADLSQSASSGTPPSAS